MKKKAGDMHIDEQHLLAREGEEHGDIQAWRLQFSKFTHD